MLGEHDPGSAQNGSTIHRALHGTPLPPEPPGTVDKKGGVGATTLSHLSSRYC